MNNKDYIIEVIQLIRNSKTDDEGRNLLLQNFGKLMETDEIRLLIENSRIEGPIDDYFMKRVQERDKKTLEDYFELNNSKDQQTTKTLIKK